MKKSHKLTVLGAGTALAAGALVIPAFAEPTEGVIRPADLIEGLSDTRDNGTVEFLGEGLRLTTVIGEDGGQAKAAEYWGHDVPIADVVGAPNQEWIGSTPAPGQQIVFDTDGIIGNGIGDYNILVGENVYGDNWWLTNGSSQIAKDADPSGDNNGGNGSQWFGTMAEWAAALPDARVYAVGFSLGSGVEGDGILLSQTYGETTFTFTENDAPVVTPEPTVVDTTGSSERVKNVRAVKLTFTSDALGENEVVGEKLSWTVRVDGRLAATITQGPGETDTFNAYFKRGSGRHLVEVSKNGEVVRNVILNVK